MWFDIPSSKMVAIGQLITPSSWGSHRALVFALVGLFSFSTLLWLSRGLVYDFSNLNGLEKVQTAFHHKSNDAAFDDAAATGTTETSVTPGPEIQSPHAAVVIETRETINLIPLILHFSNLLGPTWPVIFYTLQKNWEMPTSHAFRRAIHEGRVRLRFLPRDTDMSTAPAVSNFLTSPWLWEQLKDFDRVLLFQTDSVLCSRAPGSVDDFLHWDFVGAPIGGGIQGWGYNGGLSLRNPSVFLDIAREGGFDPYIDQPRHLAYEDQWFYHKLGERNDTRLPTKEEAKKFSVETIFYETPLGYHQPQRWQSAHMDEIESYCPEVNMLLKRRIQGRDAETTGDMM